MRKMMLAPLLLVSACSDGGEAPKKEKAAAVEKLDAGQWELATEVTQFTKSDQGTPRIDSPVGTKETASICIAEADVAKPQPAIFSGLKDKCTYGNYYMSNGRLSATLTCTRPGLSGNIGTNVDASFTAQTIEGTLRTDTYFTTDGDVRITRKLTGRRTGAQCSTGAAGKEKAA